MFHTGWFAESLATQVLVIFIIRTRGSPFASRPHPALLLTSLGIVGVAMILPFTPLANVLGFAPLPAEFFGLLAGLMVVYLVLVEIDETLAGLARGNAAANDISAGVLTLDVTAGAEAFAAAGLGPDSADVVLMNPPFNDAERHRASPDPARQSAHVAASDTLERWTHAARRVLKSGGVLTLIWRADGLSEVLAALERGFGSLAILPVHPGPKGAAIRVIVTAVKGGRAPLALHPGLVLQDPDGEGGAEATIVLGGKAALSLASR